MGFEMVDKSFRQQRNFIFKFLYFHSLSFGVKWIFLDVVGKVHVNRRQHFAEIAVGSFSVGQNKESEPRQSVQTFECKSIGVQGIDAAGHDGSCLFGHCVQGMKGGGGANVIVVGKFWQGGVEIALVDECTRAVGDVEGEQSHGECSFYF